MVRHADNIPLVVQLLGDDLNDLAQGELLFVAAVIQLAGRGFGLIHGQQDGVG